MDQSFGAAGLVPTGVGSGGRDVAIDSEGRILAAYSEAGGGPAGVIRLLPDGSFDTSFSGDGIARYNGIEIAGRVAVDAQDRVLFAGHTGIDLDTGAANVVRFTEAGSLDNSFDGNGSRGLGNFEVTGLQVRPDGRVLLGLVPFNVFVQTIGADSRSRILQLTAAGAPDGSFGNGGTVNADFAFPGADRSILDDLALRADGRVVANLRIQDPDASNVVIRLTGNGTPDPSLNNGTATQAGWAVLPSSWGLPRAVTSDSAGRILVTGTVNTSEGQRAGLGRLNSNGTPDASFGNGGLVIANPAPSADYPEDVAVASDGRIWISGSSSNPDVPEHFLLARFLGNGAVDASFSQDGNASAAIGSGLRMALDSLGRVVMVGTGDGSQSLAPEHTLIARYLRDGVPSTPTPTPPPPGGGGGSSGGSGGVAGGLATSARNVTVHRLLAPRSMRKLAKRGVRVLASCDEDCQIVLEVRVSQAVANAMGLTGTVLARRFVDAAGGQPRWLWARFNGDVRRALRGYAGGGRLQVHVTGVAR
jgi:uncharacterized delta-60 repeat protein